VKLEYDLYRALPLGHSASVKPATEVYTIGTPLDAKLGQTVTKGVVSGYREEYGQRMIQSDVNILPGNSGGPLLDRNGNVVGIAVSGMSSLGVGVGVNYFVPIEDALEALRIRLATSSPFGCGESDCCFKCCFHSRLAPEQRGAA
jgi:serine protease Do